jgi:hypothetical protein
MERRNLQLSVRVFLVVVAAVALNVWLFRLGFLWGLIGLNLSKHLAIAVLCRRVGVNKVREAEPTEDSASPEAMECAGMVAEGEER